MNSILQECKVFEEVLTVISHASRLRIKLKGQGISPAIKVSHVIIACLPQSLICLLLTHFKL